MLNRILNWLAQRAPIYLELEHRAGREHRIMRTYAGALRDILIAGGAVKKPNGTTQKLNRIAAAAFDDAAKIVCA